MLRLQRLAVLLLSLAWLPGCANPLADPTEDSAQTGRGTDELAGPDVGPSAAKREQQRGLASWYGLPFHGRRTASGERFDMTALTAAHPTLPFGTLVKVRNLASGREVMVRINDRGPHAPGRIIDLSHAAAKAIGLLSRGTQVVALTVLQAGGS